MRLIKIVGISIVLALLLVSLLFLGFKLFGNKAENDVPAVKKEKPVLGEDGSTHEHGTLLLSVDGKKVNFLNEKYMLQDTKVHFEDDNGVVVHKHAHGVTLPYFFETLGFSLTDDCVTLDTGRQYCSSEVTKNTLSIIINGVHITDVENYEIKQGDKILINYGDDTDIMLKFKFNSVPNLPAEF